MVWVGRICSAELGGHQFKDPGNRRIYYIGCVTWCLCQNVIIFPLYINFTAS